MALNIETIPFAIISGGSQTINHVLHVGKRARAVVFSHASNKEGTNSQVWGFGVDDGVKHIGRSLACSDEAFGIFVTSRDFASIYSIVTVQAQIFFGGAPPMLHGYVTAFNIGSFDVHYDINNTVGANWFATIICGDDVNDVKCKVEYRDPQTEGSGVENLGFAPVALITVGTVDFNTQFSNVAGAYGENGFAVPCGDVQVALGASCHPSDPNGSVSWVLQNISTNAVNTDTQPGNSLVPVTKITGWSSTDGLTFLCTPISAGDLNTGFLAIGGSAVSANLVQIVQPDSMMIQNIPIQAVQPVAVFFASCNKTASGVMVADAVQMFGTYDGVNSSNCWWGTQDNVPALYSYHAVRSTTRSVRMRHSTGRIASVTDAEAAVSFSAGNLALNWTIVNDTIDRVTWALVLARNLSSVNPYSPCGAVNPNEGTGIHKIVENRTHDTIYTIPPATIDRKIP